MNIFATARRLGIIVPGFVGTYADICEQVDQAEQQKAELDAENAWLRHAENNPRQRWEMEQDDIAALMPPGWTRY